MRVSLLAVLSQATASQADLVHRLATGHNEAEKGALRKVARELSYSQL